MPKHLTRIIPVDALPDPAGYEEGYPLLFEGKFYTLQDDGGALTWTETGGGGGEVFVAALDGVFSDAFGDHAEALEDYALAVGIQANAGYEGVAVGTFTPASPGDVVIGAWADVNPWWSVDPDEPHMTGTAPTVAAQAGAVPAGNYQYYVVGVDASGIRAMSPKYVSGQRPYQQVVLGAESTVTFESPTHFDFGGGHWESFELIRRDTATQEIVRVDVKTVGDLTAGGQDLVDDGATADPITLPAFSQDYYWTEAVCIGYSAMVGDRVDNIDPQTYGATVIGAYANAGVRLEGLVADYAVVIGHSAKGSALNVVAVGANANADADDSVAIGESVTTSRVNEVRVGDERHVHALAGGIELETATVTAAYTIDATNKQTVVLGDATSAAFNVTLPAAASGRTVIVKKIDASANAVTVVPASGTIDGAANHALATQYDAVRLVSDGTNWFVI